MAEWIALGVNLVVIAALSWWSARAPDVGPGDELARRYREKGGTWGL
ncbi:MAG: hypothetical protein QOD68_3329 [Actinomycetota bacterium]|jgi:hypothetical protein|nr:hypothetical protein [Actinomycetota bacterium]